MHIFFATDGSASARFAQAQILALPWRTPAHITVMTVTHGLQPAFTPRIPTARLPFAAAVDEVRATREVRAAEIVDKARLAVEGRAASVAVRVHEGTPGPTIVGMARACRADLVVVGSRGLGAYKGYLLGSVSDYVARHADCSVLLVKTPPGRERRFLLAIGDSAQAEAMFRWMGELDLSEGAWIHEVMVVRSPETLIRLEGADRRAARGAKPFSWAAYCGYSQDSPEPSGGESPVLEAVRVTASVRCGQEAPGILASVQDIRPEVLVLGAGRGESPEGPQLGAVTRKLVGQAPCSVLIVRS